MNLFVRLLILLVSFPIAAAEWSGTVVGISDGDTLTVLNADKRQVKIRLAEIDAPESKQAFGTQSKKSLSDLCFKKTMTTALTNTSAPWAACVAMVSTRMPNRSNSAWPGLIVSI